MAVRSGRLEKRIQLSLPVQISNPFDPSKAERTTTENVCSLGMRVLTQKAKELNERLMIRSLEEVRSWSPGRYVLDLR